VFVSCSYFRSSLIYPGKAIAYPNVVFRGLYSKRRLLAYKPCLQILVWKWLAVKNTPSFPDMGQIAFWHQINGVVQYGAVQYLRLALLILDLKISYNTIHWMPPRIVIIPNGLSLPFLLYRSLYFISFVHKYLIKSLRIFARLCTFNSIKWYIKQY